MIRLTKLSEWLLRQPLAWGGLATMAFYALVVREAGPGSALEVGFAGSSWPFQAAACILAFSALAFLGMRLLGIVVQYGALQRDPLPPPAPRGAALTEVVALLSHLDKLPSSYDETYLGAWLRRALEGVRQRGSADSLEADLRMFAEDDRRTLGERFAGARMAAGSVLAIGCTGVVAAVAGPLSGIARDNLDAALPGVIRALGEGAYSLIAAAIMAAIVLVAAFGVERTERRLLHAASAAARRQLIGRFVAYGTDKDPHLASIQRMSEKLLQTVETSAQRQDAELANSLAAANRRWEDMAAAASSHLQRSIGEAIGNGVSKLAGDLQGTLVRHAEILSDNVDQHTAALNAALERHTTTMTAAEKSLATETMQRLTEMEAAMGEALVLNATRQEKLIAQSEALLREMQTALVDAAGTAVAHQEQLVKQSEVLLKVVDATGQVRRLEEALNSNLLSLAASHNFEQTVASLAAAVQLLGVRLRQPAIIRNDIDLGGDDSTSQAA